MPTTTQSASARRCRAAALLLLALLVLPATLRAAPEPSRSADAFVDAMGVCTHWSYGDTPYGFATEKVKKLLGELGVRHVRDGFHERERDLYETLGIKTTVIVGPERPVSEIVALLRQNISLVEMVEGPNEVDIFPQNARYAGLVFPEGARRFQSDLYAALKADPITSRLQVIAPSTARRGSNGALAPLTALDTLVMHSYAGGQMPSLSLDSPNGSNIAEAERILGVGAALPPIVVTESGYHTALGSSVVIGGAQPGVSERAQAKYLPRHFAEYFNAGIVRTFTYEFVDEFPDYEKSEREATNAEACFGIVKRDLAPKPAFTALRNLIALLREASWDAPARRWRVPRFVPRALDFTLGGQTADVHHTLLQKANGDFYLLLWREVSSFDTKTATDIANSDAVVTLGLGTKIRSAAVYRPDAGTQALQTLAKPSRIALRVPDAVLIVRLTPERVTQRRRALAAPAGLTATTTGTSVRLTWRPVAGAAGYFVWRQGRTLGRVPSAAFTDAGRTPGRGYRYAVEAYDAAGNVSPPAARVAATKVVFPDLVVIDIAWTPARPKPGEAVTFRATIMNRGTAPTPPGVTLGVYFSVDGKGVAWSDTSHDPLAPGASRTLAASNGPGGTKFWTATKGGTPHVVTAFVDDVNRIAESDENNNTRQNTLPEISAR